MEAVKTTKVTPVVQRQTAATPAAKGSALTVQTSLKVSSPTDAAEVEAVSTARKVMRMSVTDSAVSNMTSSGKVFRTQHEVRRDKIQRKGEGTPSVSSGLSSEIQNSFSEGSPMATGVRGFMEPRFNADFGNVKVHSSERSAGMNAQLSAKAFTVGNHMFFGRDQYRPESNDGKELIAHELTHTIQQGATIQRSEDTAVTQTTGVQVQRLGLDTVLDYFADKANHIPGFRMLTFLLGFNPINMSTVARTGANLLRALIELIPGGHFITQALDNHGVIDKAGAWLEQKISVLGNIGADIKNGLKRFLDSLSWTDVFSPGDVWDRAKRIFTDPIGRLIEFGKSVAVEILKMVKDAILKPLAALAKDTKGYDLLKAILGQDPITGETVPQTAETLIGGFMKLIGQEEIWENIKKANAIDRAFTWFKGALNELLAFVKGIPQRIIDTLTSLTFQDIITIVGAFVKIGKVFLGIAGDFLSWGLKQVISLLEIIFAVVAPGVMPYIRKAQATFHVILKNPIGFVGNLVRAGKLGFQRFADNILLHLKTALIKWLTGPLGDAGVYIPTSFSLMEIIKLVLSVLGLTWQNIRSKLVKIIPEPILAGLEKTASVLVTLVTQGPAAAWEQIKGELTELKDQLIGQVTEMITMEVVKAAVKKLVMMLNPAGAIIQAIIAIYNTVTFFIDKIKQIAEVVGSFIDSIAAIAAGQVDSAAKKVEQTMANTLTLIISFLAKFAGLGGIPEKLVGIVKKIRAPIDKGLDKIVGWLGNILKKFVAAAKSKVASWLGLKKEFVTENNEKHQLYFSGNPGAAKMMVASAPLEIEAFISMKKGEATGDKEKKAIKSIEGLVKEAKRQMNKASKNEADESVQKEIEKTMNAIAPFLIILLSDSEWGTAENPAPLDYQKRRASSYPVFYLTNDPTLKKQKQNTLAAKFGTKEFKDKIWKFFPTITQQVPTGGESLGLSAGSNVEVGKRLEFDDRAARAGKVGAFKTLVEKFGYIPSEYGMDVDHVIELQVGGRDEYVNLWPLPKGENRSSGSIIKSTKLDLPKKSLKIEDAHALKKKGKKDKSLWLIIKSTRQL